MPPKLSGQPLTPDAKRLRTIIISFPLFVATSWILYKRGWSFVASNSHQFDHKLIVQSLAYMGEEQRTIPQPGATASGRPEENKVFAKPAQGFSSR